MYALVAELKMKFPISIESNLLSLFTKRKASTHAHVRTMYSVYIVSCCK